MVSTCAWSAWARRRKVVGDERATLGGEGVVPDESQNPQRIAELADILWAHIRGLDQVRLLRACLKNHAVLFANRLTISRIIASRSSVSLVCTFRS
jgi:hypothetical protein